MQRVWIAGKWTGSVSKETFPMNHLKMESRG